MGKRPHAFRFSTEDVSLLNEGLTELKYSKRTESNKAKKIQDLQEDIIEQIASEDDEHTPRLVGDAERLQNRK